MKIQKGELNIKQQSRMASSYAMLPALNHTVLSYAFYHTFAIVVQYHPMPL